jgi:transposase
LQRSWAVLHHEGMNAYSEDLRKKIVEAVERGMPKIEAARTFGVGISSVKRYVAAAREGRSLAPKKRPGSKPKLDEGARRLLEADLEERPAATLPERRDFLRRVRGVEVSDSTVSRVLKRMGWTRKKDRWVRAREREEFLRAAWPVMVAGEVRTERLVVCGRVLHQHLVGTPVRIISRRRASALLVATQLGGERDALGVHERGRDGLFLGG